MIASVGPLWPQVGPLMDVFQWGGAKEGYWREWSLILLLCSGGPRPGWVRQGSKKNSLFTSRDFWYSSLYKQLVYLQGSYSGFLLCTQLVCAFCWGPQGRGQKFGLGASQIETLDIWIFHLISSKYICSLYSFHLPSSTATVSTFTNRYVLINCPSTVEYLVLRQGAKLCNNWN